MREYWLVDRSGQTRLVSECNE